MELAGKGASVGIMVFVSVLIGAAGCSAPPIRPVDLKCEYANNPLGIDEARPRLSWILQSDLRGQRQTAYQIQVASSEKKLEAGKADLWDSGRMLGDQSIQVEYAGRPLNSGQRCYWRIRVWDREGEPSAWSAPAWWEMGLTGGFVAQWLDDGKGLPIHDRDFYGDDPMPIFRNEFRLNGPITRARLYISGLGYYEATLNGRRVGDHVLDPGWTTYGKRVLYSTYDVTEQLRRGANCIGVTLGNGWYNPLPMRMWGKLDLREHLLVGRPRFIAQLEVEYRDGTRRTIASNQTWKVAYGPVVRNSVYLGERYDARQEVEGWNLPGFDDAFWRPASIAREPVGQLCAQMQPAIRVTGHLKAVKMAEPKPGVFIFDLGQNFAGVARLKVRGPAGTGVRLRYGELLYPDGTLNGMTAVCGQIKGGGQREEVAPEMRWSDNPQFGTGAPRTAFQVDTYILKGEGQETYTPRFTFHGFRYVEVTGYPGRPAIDAIEGLRMSADVKPAGTFECSNELFNRIQKAARWTFLSNLFSVQSDCPHREKFGYGGDIVPTSDAFLLNFDMAGFYSKVVNDFADAARPNGGMTETAPFVGIADRGPGGDSGPIAWEVAHPVLQAKLWQYYGDRRMMQRQYEATRKFVEFLRSSSKDNIIDACIGDHESLDPRSTALTSTAFYYHAATLMSRFAGILDKPEDARKYAALAGQIKTAFVDRFLKPGTGRFDIGTQACQAFALHYKLVPPHEREAAFDAMVEDVLNKHEGHLATGIFGTKFLLDELTRGGRADVAYAVANQKTFPGWGYMLEKGATTLWEHWAFSDNTYSHNHPMFGSISTWFCEALGGIRADESAVGFNRIVIEPQIASGLKWAKVGYNSIHGPVRCQWRRDGDRLRVDVTVPVGAIASLRLPPGQVDDVEESGREMRWPEKRELDLESGNYSFTMRYRR